MLGFTIRAHTVNPIDNLTYLYDDFNKNLLLRVFDATANQDGFKDDTTGSDINNDINDVPDYEYDANGNMTSDANKGILNITYNHLNLPVEIVFPNGTITYLYNAVGQKTTKTVTQGTTIIITDYLNGFQYKNAKLQFFPHAEGYVNTTASGRVSSGSSTSYSFNYVFNFTDHLGNVRLSYGKDRVTEELKIIEENHYYPFGLKHEGYNSYQAIANKYRFENKEWQDELGLNWYDFGGRNYMPDIVRTPTQDPLSEKFTNVSPYSFLNNNPVYFIDPTGMATEQNEWIPKLNEDGSTSYIAEKGDTAATFAKQYNLSESQANQIVGNKTYEGMEVSGQQVLDVMGTEKLKLDLNSGMDTGQRKIDQFIYAMHHSKSKGANFFKAQDYFQNILTGELQTPQNIKGNVALDNGQTATIQMSLPFYTSRGSFFSGGTTYHYAFYSNKSIVSPSQGNGSMFGGNQAINHYKIGYGFIFDGKPVLQGGSQDGIWMSILRKYDNSFERTILDRKVPHFRYHNFNFNPKN